MLANCLYLYSTNNHRYVKYLAENSSDKILYFIDETETYVFQLLLTSEVLLSDKLYNRFENIDNSKVQLCFDYIAHFIKYNW